MSNNTTLFLGFAAISLIIAKSFSFKNKKKALIEFSREIQNNGEPGFEPIIEKMTTDEISTVYDVVILKKPVFGNLRTKFLLLSEKYNIFT